MTDSRRPVGLWITAAFAGLVAMSLLGNVVGWMLGQQSDTETLVRPQALLAVSAIGGVLHLMWCRASWAKSVNTPIWGWLCLAFLLLAALTFWIAPGLYLSEGDMTRFQFRPEPFAVWGAIYVAFIAAAHFYKRRGYLG